jgi:hypothetical protein
VTLVSFVSVDLGPNCNESTLSLKTCSRIIRVVLAFCGKMTENKVTKVTKLARPGETFCSGQHSRNGWDGLPVWSNQRVEDYR